MHISQEDMCSQLHSLSLYCYDLPLFRQARATQKHTLITCVTFHACHILVACDAVTRTSANLYHQARLIPKIGTTNESTMDQIISGTNNQSKAPHNEAPCASSTCMTLSLTCQCYPSSLPLPPPNASVVYCTPSTA